MINTNLRYNDKFLSFEIYFISVGRKLLDSKQSGYHERVSLLTTIYIPYIKNLLRLEIEGAVLLYSIFIHFAVEHFRLFMKRCINISFS